MTLPELYNYIELEEMRGSDILEELYIEKYRRYADPVAVIILTLIGFAMSSRKIPGGNCPANWAGATDLLHLCSTAICRAGIRW